jgi:hypothetical protein
MICFLSHESTLQRFPRGVIMTVQRVAVDGMVMTAQRVAVDGVIVPAQHADG